MKTVDIGDIYTISLLKKYYICFYKTLNGWLALQLDFYQNYTDEELVNKICAGPFSDQLVIIDLMGNPNSNCSMKYVRTIDLGLIDPSDIIEDYYQFILSTQRRDISNKAIEKLVAFMKICPKSDEKLMSLILEYKRWWRE